MKLSLAGKSFYVIRVILAHVCWLLGTDEGGVKVFQ